MISTAVLFSTPHLPDHPAFDIDAITGLAEWRQTTPMLFKLLLGDAAQAFTWPLYGDGEERACVLAAPMAQARASWQALSALMAPPRDAQAMVARSAIASLLADGEQWLVFDCVQLIAHDIGTAEFANELQALADEAASLRAALLRGDQAALGTLLAASADAIGYWCSSASAHLGNIEERDIAELPFLHRLQVHAWVEQAQCYDVSAIDDPAVHGLVTPYGRWIVPLAMQATELGTHDAENGWLTYEAASPALWQGLLDLNGMVVMPPAPGKLYLISPHLVLRLREHGASSMLHLPDGALVMEGVDNTCERNDGLLDFERPGNDGGDHNVHGVMDEHGAVVVPPVYSSVQDFGTRKKIAIVSQRIAGRFLFGLVNIQGAPLAPCQYSYIDSATTSSPPKLRQHLVYAIDAQGLACMLTLDGKQAFAPKYAPAHHLHGISAQNDCLFVVKDAMVWRMDFAGELLVQVDTVDGFKADISAQLNAALGLAAAPQVERNSYTPGQIIKQADHDQLRAIATLLLRGDDRLARRCVDLTLEELEQDDPEEEYEGDTPEAACLFLLWSTAADALGHGTTLDWKSVDEIAVIGRHIAVPALRDFTWNGDEDGASINDGFEAIAHHLAPHGLKLVNMHDGADTYWLAVLRQQDMAAFHAIARQSAVNPLVY
ncbi:WG repeat-containing protein [Janthinobacterium sp. PC23-8]|uniref:DUF6630 family protein n=1 Tax=Janthinobacterium sp. PC23-8 TaxID=2012679 RepID=UPI000B973E4E|nr:WG repeat-containing protein [Janthinobacterium sp. PC23-8]OYO29035.1 hypothetical protein CD932_18085 [Janthinobacterium sp. PC23-8]